MKHIAGSPSSLAGAVAPLLRTRGFGRMIREHASVESTNTLAAEWSAEGASEGSIVLAEYQTRGRGRLGRSWEAAPGLNLMFSVVLYPRLPADALGLLTMAGALAVSEAVENTTAPFRPEIKWPNDVLLNGRKCCGMLLESSPAGRPSARSVVLGIGLNVNQDTFPPELADKATSLLLETGRPIDRAALLADLLSRLETWYERLHTAPSEVHQAYQSRLSYVGQEVAFRLSSTSERVSGVLEGVTPNGALMLSTREGRRTYFAGEITTHLADEPAP